MSTSLAVIMSPPTIVATLANSQGLAAIYITEDPGVNNLIVTVTNNTGADLSFPAGLPSAQGALPAGQSNLYLFFNGLLENSSIEALTAGIVEGGWTAAVFTQAGVGDYLAFGPGSTVVLPNGQSLSISLTDLTTAGIGQPGGNISLSWRNVETFADDSYQTFLSIAPLTNGEPNFPPLDIGFTPDNRVITGGRANSLSLYLSNASRSQLVPDETPWGSNDPEFRLYFIAGSSPGNGALTDQASLVNISVNPFANYSQAWSVTSETGSQPPYWSIKPDATANHQILGYYAAASVAFQVANIISYLNQGVTLAYLQWLNIPGYDDGVRALELVKIPPVTIDSFAASSSTVTPPATVTLSYQVSNATSISIDNCGYSYRPAADPATGAVSVTVTGPTTYTLTAVNELTGQVATRAVTVQVNPVIPTGVIMLWSGAGDAIPAGWALCDGNNGTPNLANRFVMGGDSTYRGVSSPNVGGPDSHTHLFSYSGTLSGTTNSTGAHSHKMNFQSGHHYSIDNDPEASRPYFLYFDSNGTQTGTTTSDGDHAHTATVPLAINQYTQGSTGSDMKPKYYQLCYIIKL